MCGIAGIVRADVAPVDASALARMREIMQHRGPDDEGLHLAPGVGLAHRRLSIVDLSDAGHQPMGSPDGQVWVVLNGEIFNYLELREELRSRGHRFVSSSDTEVLLHLYQDRGQDCLRHLNGMFAFAIWDGRTRTLFAARDRLGIKPFYYCHSPEQLLFASEVKGLLAHTAVSSRPCLEAVADYLFAGAALGRKTAIDGVYQLEPGHQLTWRMGRLEVVPYWDIRYQYRRGCRDEDMLQELAALLRDAVRLHCRGDVAIGCHLSGGLDSSVVAGLATRFVRPLKTFSIRFAGGPYYDESAHAKTVARHIGAIHLEQLGHGREMARLLPRLIYHMDAPLPDPGGIGYFMVSRLARRHVKVSLTGHGGDEVFAGYPAQFQATFGSTAMFDLSTRPLEPTSPFRRLSRVLRREGVAGVARRLRQHLTPAPDSLEDLWLRLHCGPAPAQGSLLDAGFVRSLGGYSPVEEYLRPFREAPTEEVLDRCLYHDTRSYLPGLLQVEDRLSMAVSLESRLPLLDYRVVELLATIPPELKVKGLRPKRLLGEIAAGVIPESIRERRDKVPFAVPVKRWFAGDLQGLVDAVLRSPQCLDRGVFDPDWLRDSALTSSAIWALLNVELWFRLFIDRDPVWSARSLEISSAAPRPVSGVSGDGRSVPASSVVSKPAH